MSAAKRVAHAAETIRARWEQRVEESPQMEAAQALEDTCQLLDPEVAAELERLRTRGTELETTPSWLRTDELTPGVALIAKDMTRFTVDSVTPCTRDFRFQGKQADGTYTSESGMEVTGHDDKGEAVRFTAAQSYRWQRDVTAELNALRARIAELEAERHSTNEALSDAAVALRANRDRIAELEALKPAEIQAGRDVSPQVRKLRSLLAGQRAAQEADPGRRAAWRMLAKPLEDRHDSPLHHDYRLGRDLPETGGAK